MILTSPGSQISAESPSHLFNWFIHEKPTHEGALKDCAKHKHKTIKFLLSSLAVEEDIIFLFVLVLYLFIWYIFNLIHLRHTTWRSFDFDWIYQLLSDSFSVNKHWYCLDRQFRIFFDLRILGIIGYRPEPNSNDQNKTQIKQADKTNIIIFLWIPHQYFPSYYEQWPQLLETCWATLCNWPGVTGAVSQTALRLGNYVTVWLISVYILNTKRILNLMISWQFIAV